MFKGLDLSTLLSSRQVYSILNLYYKLDKKVILYEQSLVVALIAVQLQGIARTP